MIDLISVLKAVGDKNRMRILKMLEIKRMCVCEIAAVLGIKQPSVSRHLVIMKNAGLIKDERNGQWIDYALCTEAINRYAPELLAKIKGWINDDKTIIEDRKKIKTLCRERLCRKKL